MNVRLSFEPLSLILNPQSLSQNWMLQIVKEPQELFFCKSLETGQNGNEKGTGQKRSPFEGLWAQCHLCMSEETAAFANPSSVPGTVLLDPSWLKEHRLQEETCGWHPAILPKPEIELDELSN